MNKQETSNNKSAEYFRDNFQKQKEECKRKIEEKMNDCLKKRQNQPTFFKKSKS